ncbi:Protein of unknown function [Pyronema omphalodes CBS 100304]|uniref:Uncharacterized protein n=1 Tax=Pyronema omphalodes (strain CBS 100304) TaxID=1076935 RepID=U4L4C0_PYROM|nr:Protein of unknown function [Pyronema omphalodes CBS 100304]
MSDFHTTVAQAITHFWFWVGIIGIVAFVAYFFVIFATNYIKSFFTKNNTNTNCDNYKYGSDNSRGTATGIEHQVGRHQETLIIARMHGIPYGSAYAETLA